MVYFYSFYDKKKGASFYYARSTKPTKNFGRSEEIKSKQLIAKILKTQSHKLHTYNNRKWIIPGTRVDYKGNILCIPNTHQMIKTKTDRNETLTKYPVIDGTSVILDKGYLGTANSWDISNIEDCVKGNNYAHYFSETCAAVNFYPDDLPSGTNLLFSNPNIHYGSNDHVIVEYTDEGCIFHGIEVYDPIGSYTTYDPVKKELMVYLEKGYSLAINKMYSDRIKLKSDTIEEHMNKIFEKWFNSTQINKVVSDIPVPFPTVELSDLDIIVPYLSDVNCGKLDEWTEAYFTKKTHEADVEKTIDSLSKLVIEN